MGKHDIRKISASDIVEAWQAAVNAGDLDQLIALSAKNIEVGGPRGTSFGQQVLREWFGRAGIHLRPLQTLALGNKVVVEQQAQWASADTGEATGDRVIASLFEVLDGVVTKVIRFPDFDSALDHASLGFDQ